jgi:hypothetical protein
MIKLVRSINLKLTHYKQIKAYKKFKNYNIILYSEDTLTLSEQRDYVSNLNSTIDYLIVTDSVYIISDVPRKAIYIINSDNISNVETYGADINNILLEYFNINFTRKKAVIEMNNLSKNNTDIEYLESRLKDFGDSLQKFYLMRHIQQLKEQQHKNS